MSPSYHNVPIPSESSWRDGADPSLPLMNIFMENLRLLLAGIWSEDSDSQLKATNILHRLVSAVHAPPISAVIHIGVVPRMVLFLSRDDFPQLQLKAARVLTNIAAGTSKSTNVVVESGAVPILIQLLSSPNEDVREQAVWTLGNIAVDSPKYRDLVLNHNAMIPLLSQLIEHKSLSMLKTATWTLSNLCRGKPPPSFEQTKTAIPVLERLVQSTDEEVLTDACCALSCLSDNSNDKGQAVTDAGFIPHLVKLLSHPSPSVLLPTLCTIGNIVACDERTQKVLDHQVLPCLLNLLTNTYEKNIKKKACWIISKIIAGNSDRIQAVVEAGTIEALVLVLQTAELEVKKEAALGISNAICRGTHDQIKFMVSQGCMKPICDLLTCLDARTITVCLEALENIFVMVGESETGDENLCASMIDEAEGLEKIKNLQSYGRDDINQKAAKILEIFWTEDNRLVRYCAAASRSCVRLFTLVKANKLRWVTNAAASFKELLTSTSV